MAQFKLTGKVTRTDDNGTTTLASGSVVKEFESAEAMKAAWLRDMKLAFPQEPTADIDYICTVEPA